MNHAKRHKEKSNEHRRDWERRGRKGGKGAAWRGASKKKKEEKKGSRRKMVHKLLVK